MNTYGAQLQKVGLKTNCSIQSENGKGGQVIVLKSEPRVLVSLSSVRAALFDDRMRTTIRADQANGALDFTCASHLKHRGLSSNGKLRKKRCTRDYV